MKVQEVVRIVLTAAETSVFCGPMRTARPLVDQCRDEGEKRNLPVHVYSNEGKLLMSLSVPESVFQNYPED
jgi:hypothetical protein